MPAYLVSVTKPLGALPEIVPADALGVKPSRQESSLSAPLVAHKS
jgi:hypothetical protein